MNKNEDKVIKNGNKNEDKGDKNYMIRLGRMV